MSGVTHLPGLLGIELEEVSAERVVAHLEIRDDLLSPTGFVHSATLVALADSACGYGTLAGLPDGAAGFATVELKANLLQSAIDGSLACDARRRHAGGTTQVWDAEISRGDRLLAVFRCTQLILGGRRRDERR